jgi:CheY-like chemotaxis protein
MAGVCILLVSRKNQQETIVLRVLIVEDEPHIRYLISSILKPLGYEVVEATNGLEALLLLAQTADIGLIISDVRMPELDGIDLTEEVKQVYPHVPVIIISAFSDDALEAVERGADYFIVKPFTRDQLLAIVRTAAQA